MLKSTLLIVMMLVSPIWPLGPQPLPGDPFLMVNKNTHQLAYVQDGHIQMTFPVATGRTKELTPEGLFTITVKAKHPYYRKKDIPGHDPDNPLGSRWIGFDARGTNGRIFGVHGTNAPHTIGSDITNGCIRLTNDNVEKLFEKVPLGTKILITASDNPFEQLAREYGAME